MNVRRFFSFALVALSSVLALAQVHDSIKASLVTCSPGPEVYSQYGHTALRCRNFTTGEDVVFNYGVFSFDQPNFIWRFVLGECDYMVIPVPWRYFLPEYVERGSDVTEQTLNLTQSEARKLYGMLKQNCLPENRVYRYNFFYNNCTTMVRDMIERAVDGKVVYPDTLALASHREMLHQYTCSDLWTREGIDLLLGSDVDTIVSARAAMFAPEYMMRYADGAVIRSINNDSRPLVSDTEITLHRKAMHREPLLPVSPLYASLCLLAFCMLVVCLEYAFRRMFWLWDAVLLLCQGVTGLLLLFLLLFSVHPGVGSNWLVWLLNPLALLGIPVVIKSAYKHQKTLWHPVYFAILTLFIVFSPWIPQNFGNLIVPLALAFLTRPVSYYLHYKRIDSK